MFACSTSIKPDTLDLSHCVQEQGECDRVRKDLANLDSESKDAQALISRLAEEQVRYVLSRSATGDVRPLVSFESFCNTVKCFQISLVLHSLLYALILRIPAHAVKIRPKMLPMITSV